jgi:hypothetical protein
MRLVCYLLFTAAIAVEASDKIGRNGEFIQPEHAGSVLKEAFDKLADMYSVNKPKNREDMKNDSSNILLSLCKENDLECKSSMEELFEEELVDDDNEPEEIDYPDNFDPKLMNYMEKVESTLEQFTMENVDEVLKDLNNMKKEIEDMDDVSADDKDTALIGIHIALQSVQMWHKTYSDPSHPLYGVHDPSHYFNADKKLRKLKDIDVAAISMSDFQAGFNKVARMLSDENRVLDTLKAVSAGARVFQEITKRCYGYYYHGWYHGHHNSHSSDSSDTDDTDDNDSSDSSDHHSPHHHYNYFYRYWY